MEQVETQYYNAHFPNENVPDDSENITKTCQFHHGALEHQKNEIEPYNEIADFQALPMELINENFFKSGAIKNIRTYCIHHMKESWRNIEDGQLK
jgi:hypothetical protein